MKGLRKVFVQFSARINRDWKRDLHSFKDSYKRSCGPMITSNGYSGVRASLYTKIDSMLDFMKDYSYNCFILHLTELEFEALKTFEPWRRNKYESLLMIYNVKNSEWQYDLAMQHFYDCVFSRFKNVKELPSGKFNWMLNEANPDILSILQSSKIKYNKRTFRKLSSSYNIISRWHKRKLF